MDLPGKVANPARGQLNKEKRIFTCPSTRLRIWSRETGSAVPSGVSLFISILRLWCLLTGFLPISAVASVFFLEPPYAIRSVPTLSGFAIAYRWRSLPRVRRHRGPIILKVVPVTGTALAGHHGPFNVRLSFPTPTDRSPR